MHGRGFSVADSSAESYEMSAFIVYSELGTVQASISVVSISSWDRNCAGRAMTLEQVVSVSSRKVPRDRSVP